jgi:hypothetical protein
MKLTDPQVLELCKKAGFKIFGNRIVAADNGSSGEATRCARKLVELTLALNQGAVLCEELYPVPDNTQDELELLKSLQRASDTLPDGHITGALLSFSVADGYAYYLVKSDNPLELQHVPLFDAYRVQEAFLRGLTRDDVARLVASEQKLHRLFQRAPGGEPF